MAVHYKEEHMFSYLKGMAEGLGWNNTIQALYIARRDHKEQLRKSGEPYIVHPLTVACHLVAIGIREDDIIAAAILHDWKEDCKGSFEYLPFGDEIKHAIDCVSFDKHKYASIGITDKQEMLRLHYMLIENNKIATLVKLSDRCNNVSTMSGVFSKNKIDEYIKETRDFVLPLVESGKNKWPNYSNAFFIMKYHIISVIDGIEAAILTYNK